jgi:signal transduction histidine kinase
MNLFSNALKYHHPLRDPRITISSLGDANDEDLITIVVEDNGRGFPDGAEQRMFELFRRLSATESIEGSGFGLGLCRKIVRRHHGTISAEHSPTGGARFLIALPFR